MSIGRCGLGKILNRVRHCRGFWMILVEYTLFITASVARNPEARRLRPIEFCVSVRRNSPTRRLHTGMSTWGDLISGNIAIASGIWPGWLHSSPCENPWAWKIPGIWMGQFLWHHLMWMANIWHHRRSSTLVWKPGHSRLNMAELSILGPVLQGFVRTVRVQNTSNGSSMVHHLPGQTRNQQILHLWRRRRSFGRQVYPRQSRC